MTQYNEYLTVEDFYLAYQHRFNSLFDGSTQVLAQELHDKNIGESDLYLDKVKNLHEMLKNSCEGRDVVKLSWVTKMKEKSTALNFTDWIGFCVDKADETFAGHTPGYSDLEFNLETIWRCGVQMTELYSAEWAKNRLVDVYASEDFDTLNDVQMPFTVPLSEVARSLHRDLVEAVDEGMRNPYAYTVAVGSVWLKYQVGDNEPIEIPVVRFVKGSNLEKMSMRLKEEAKQHVENLKITLAEHKKHLDWIPENWPNEGIYAQVQEWKAKEFLGDRGLMGSDFFEGSWVKDFRGVDIHRKISHEEQQELVKVQNDNEMKLMQARILQRKAGLISNGNREQKLKSIRI